MRVIVGIELGKMVITSEKKSHDCDTQANPQDVFHRLSTMYPHATCELNFRDPFELLVATVLSAQTTDVRVNSVTGKLFASYPDAYALAAANYADVAEIIKSTGFYKVKTQSIITLSRQLVTEFGGEVPRTLAELITLKGVGRKTANVVLGNAFNVPGLTVDTHFGRLSRRLGWSSSQDPVVVENEVGQLFPPQDWTALSHYLIFHGRRVCHSRRPACGACFLADQCPSRLSGVVEPELASAMVKGPEREHLLELVGLS